MIEGIDEENMRLEEKKMLVKRDKEKKSIGVENVMDESKGWEVEGKEEVRGNEIKLRRRKVIWMKMRKRIVKSEEFNKGLGMGKEVWNKNLMMVIKCRIVEIGRKDELKRDSIG